jgi:uncharacterized membrane protein YecN with MAPEG domain
MELLTVITMLALLQFILFAMKVGGARAKYGVDAPATSGHEEFERHYRVQYNTMEQLILFIPALWGFGYYISEIYAAGLGGLYLVGRAIYASSYVKEPKTRAVGMITTMIPNFIMIIGAIVGALMKYFGQM